MTHTPSLKKVEDRSPYGYYSSDPSCIASFLDSYNIDPTHVLEPSAGSGTLSKAVLNRYPNANITQVEIQEQFIPDLQSMQCGEVVHTDFLTFFPKVEGTYYNCPYSCIIMNPDYRFTKEHIKHALDIAQGQCPVIAQVNLSFFESAKRFKFHQMNLVNELYLISKRPKFGDQKNASPYNSCFAVWNSGLEQKIRVI